MQDRRVIAASSERQRPALINLVTLDDTILVQILSFLHKLMDLPVLMMCSRSLRSMVCGAHSVWSEGSTDICLGGANVCFGCGRAPLAWKTAEFIFASTHITVVRLHIDFTMLRRAFSALSHCLSLRTVHVRLSSRGTRGVHDSHCLKPIPSMNSLVVFGWPKRSEELCCDLLRFVGANLSSLKFVESVPRDALESVRTHCPVLHKLSLEGLYSPADITNYASASLRSLNICGASAYWTQRLQLPKLSSLKCSYFENVQLSAMPNIDVVVGYLPKTLRLLDLCFDGQLVNQMILVISTSLPHLISLSLETRRSEDSVDGPRQLVTLSHTAAVALRSGCTSLTNLHILGRCVGVSKKAFLDICSFPRLQQLSLLYDEDILSVTAAAVGGSSSLQKIIFCESAQFLFDNHLYASLMWMEMETRVSSIAEQCPSIEISLFDWVCI